MIKSTTVFTLGRNYLKTEGKVADALRTDDPAAQKATKFQLKLGMVANAMREWDNLSDVAARAKAELLLKKAGKLRTDAEKAAENCARTALSRLFTKYKIVNLEARGSKPGEARKPKKAKPQADGWVADKPNAVPLAAYVRPKIEEPAAMLSHAQFVTKELIATLGLAEPVLNPKATQAYRKAFATLAAALKKIEKL
jgi:hypothetical protein